MVKIFYLAAAHRWLEDGRLKETEELTRALRDMIVDSSNDATHYVVDALTGVSNGAELPPEEMKQWAERRNAVNRYFASLGYPVGPGGINVNQKPWCEGPYGRERAFLGPKYENRNKLTTDSTARLVAEIATGRAVTPARSARMLELMKRDFSGKSEDPDDQAHGFTALGARARHALLVEGRLDFHHAPRRRLPRTPDRPAPRHRHLHHRPRQRARHHPDRRRLNHQEP